MDKRVYKERMRQKQKQLRRRRMMKKVTYIVGALLLVVFVIRGIIFPVIHRIGGGSVQTEKPADVQAEADGKNEEAVAEGTEKPDEEAAEKPEEETVAEVSETTETTTASSGPVMAMRQSLQGASDIQKALQMTAGWHEDSTGKWYRNTDGTYYVGGFQDIDGNTYAFDENGYIRTGWYMEGSKEYFFSDAGVYDSSKRRPMLALTYDDGPGQYTDQLLDCLEENGAHATFFMLGEKVQQFPDTVKRMIEVGCELGNHSYDHPNLYNLSVDSAADQYARTDEELRKVCGQISTVARCPYGNGNSDIFNAVGKPFFMWSLDSLDWSYMNADQDYDAIMNGDLTDGSIILMHDIHQPSVEASLRIIPELVERGYRLVTVSELAAAKGVNLQYASYSDFWDSSLAAGNVAGYKGAGWDQISSSSDSSSDEDYEEDYEEDYDEDYEEDYEEDYDEDYEEDYDEDYDYDEDSDEDY